ncbi:MAG: hypothetical protein GX790_03390, partial [Syntrophomonadaceae bacterium]|nr:hypothetical protein [Syntrophomonadaceae bacterium]
MLKKRSKLLAVMLVFSFALTGVAYAYWTDQLEIHGTVKTGTLDVYFTDLGWEDSEGAGSGINPSSTDVTTQAHPSKKPEPGKPGKPGGPGNDDDNNGFVANTKVALKDRNDDTLHERETTSSILQIAVENAYPGYEATIKFKIKNGGSLPAKVEQVNVEAFEIIGNEEEPVNIYDLLE